MKYRTHICLNIVFMDFHFQFNIIKTNKILLIQQLVPIKILENYPENIIPYYNTYIIFHNT